MAVSSKYIIDQAPVIAAMGRTAFSALLAQRKSKPAPSVPGPELRAHFSPRSTDLIRAYVRHVGGDPARYKTTVPPHLFPQWGFALASRTLIGIPYPLARVMNGGCRIDMRSPLPNDEPLEVSACLVDIDDDGRRAVLEQRVVTGTASAPEALIAHLYAVVPLAKKDGAAKKEKPRVPDKVKEIAYWRLGRKAGLDFAKLTGDFNPIHWIPAYARASGFKSTILHGFSTMARTFEGLANVMVPPGERLVSLDVKFTRPLILPARVGLYTSGREVYVGDAPGGPAYLVGSYSLGPS